MIIKKWLWLSVLGLLGLAGSLSAGQDQWTSSGPSSAINVVLPHPSSSDTLYAGGVDGFYRSEDSGQTWEKLEGTLSGHSVWTLVNGNGNRLYAGLSAGLFFSDDGGESWTLAEAAGTGVLSVATGPEGSNLVYAGTFGRGVLVSPDQGATWESGDGLQEGAMIFALAADPQDGHTAYAGTDQGLFVSRDTGATWSALGETLATCSIRSIYRSPVDTGLVVVGTLGQGVFKSADSGQTWTPINSGLEDLAIRSLAVSPQSDRFMYVATLNGGFFRTRDGGGQWAPINASLPQLKARRVRALSLEPERILGVGPGDGVWEITLIPEADISVDPEALEFGEVKVGTEQHLSLRLENAGSADLVLDDIRLRPGSGFFLRRTSGDTRVAPQAADSLDIRFKPHRRGSFRDTLILFTNDLDQRLVRIPLEGAGIQAELVAAPVAVDFGMVLVDLASFVDTSLVLRNAGDAAAHLRRAGFTDPAFQLLSFQPDTLAPGEELELIARFAPGQRDVFASELELLTDIQLQEEFVVPFRGQGIAPLITVLPTVLNFDIVEIEDFRQQALGITNDGDADLVVEPARLGGNQFRVEPGAAVSIPPGESRTYVVTFLPNAAGTWSDTLVLASNAPGERARVAIPLKGTGRRLALSPEPPIRVGKAPVAMVLSDLDGDGDLDVALADSLGGPGAPLGQVHVLLNDGAGAFPAGDRAVYPGSESDYGKWNDLVALVAAPVFGELPDLIVGDRVARSISILANDGEGGFNRRSGDIFIGHQLEDVHAADLDADGDIDIAVANGKEATSITLLFNNGQGSFSARQVVPVAEQEGPSKVVAGNLNADGHNDLVVVNRSAGMVSVLLSDRSGHFFTDQHYHVGIQPAGLTLADYDADGDRDILTANPGSGDVAILRNNGEGVFEADAPLLTGLGPLDLEVDDLSADIFNDLVVVGSGSPFIAFMESRAGEGFERRDLSAEFPLRVVDIVPLDGDRHRDIIALSTARASIQVFLNKKAGRLVPPRPPVPVAAEDVERDLGGRIRITWQDGDFRFPTLEEQLVRPTSYTVYRASSADGEFDSLAAVPVGTLSYQDTTATPYEKFFYQVRARRDTLESAPSEKVSAVSIPSPFFEIEFLNGSRSSARDTLQARAFSRGDTLRARIFVTPSQHQINGLSLYLTYDDSVLALIPDTTGTDTIRRPFRISAPVAGNFSDIVNRIHAADAPEKLNLSLVAHLGDPRPIPAGVEPVLLGEVWFRTSKDALTRIHVDDDSLSNRRSAVIDAGGNWILPFISPRPTQVTISNFAVDGKVNLQGRRVPNLRVQVTLHLIKQDGEELNSPLNDEDRRRAGVQYTLDPQGRFRLAQIPPDRYRIFVKTPTHLQGQVTGNAVTIGGDSLRLSLAFRWAAAGGDTAATDSLPAGDADDNNRVDLADFGLLMQYFGIGSANVDDWPRARRADFNGDGRIDSLDVALLTRNFGKVGVEIAPAAPKKSVPGGWVRAEPKAGAVRAGSLGEIAGFSLLVQEEVDLDLRGTVWEGHPFRYHQWREGRVLRLAGALGHPLERVAGEGVLAYLQSRIAGRQVRIGEVEILWAEGQVGRPVQSVAGPGPRQPELRQNFPNPFNPSTIIPFVVGSAPVGGERLLVRLEIFNLLGQKTRTLVEAEMPAGSYRVVWDGRDEQDRPAASGIYLYRLQVGAFLQTRRLLLVR